MHVVPWMLWSVLVVLKRKWHNVYQKLYDPRSALGAFSSWSMYGRFCVIWHPVTRRVVDQIWTGSMFLF